MATTPNYGWTTPDNTSFVKDGALAIRTVSNSIDATSAGANFAGLVLIKTQAIGTAVTSVTVTGAFSTTYDAYKVQISGGTGSSAANCNLHLGTAGIAGYYFGSTETVYTSGAIAAANGNNTTVWTCGNVSTNGISLNCDIINPNLARKTIINYQFTQLEISGRAIVGSGILDNLTQHTALTFTAGAGTFTGGTIAVYGYRKAI